MRVGLFSVWALAAIVARLSLDAMGQSPDFFEVYGLIKSNLVGVQQSELDQAAVEGLLDRLHGRVYLGTNGSSIASNAADQGTGVARTNLFAERFGYIRITNLSPKTPGAFVECLDQMSGSNRLEGLALDLRFASGIDYAAAGQIADCFFSEARALLRLGQETINSTAKTNAFTRPVAVLVNSKTTGAAEALAAVLREAGVGLLIGSKTAGRANIFKEFTLSTGQKLFIATALVKLGSGDTIQADGLAPDITVNVAADEEILYLEDPYRRPKPDTLLASQSSGETLRSTNRPAREADLVRMRREGSFILSEEASSKTP
ncbi:MAG: S41 family peptidase, partial [Verrucomicrobiota bacterium]|nr:S41 family peptidase [Verrucomicrobiota bacterium]